MNSNLDCTIVILSYNASKVTDTCLTKVEIAVRYSQKILGNKVKVTVVDNGSVDGSPQMIRKKHTGVNLIALKQNIGYVEGNNLAMKQINTPYILLMNSDTYIKKDSLAKTFQKMVERKDCDVLVSRCIYSNGVLQKYGGFLPTPFKIILWAFGFESLPVIRNFLHRIYGFTNDFYEQERFMEWCSPNFMLIRQKVYKLTGGFDPKLWFHMVDVEWCQRIHQKGLVIGFTPTVEVTHLGGASSKDIQSQLLFDNFKGLMHFCKKHYPAASQFVFFMVRIGLIIRSNFYFFSGNHQLAATYKEISGEIRV